MTDQRFADGRPDVLTYVTPPLTEPLRIGGAPIVNLIASTSGTDSDWVVKLIDVYPEEVTSQPELGGYQLAVAMDIFRGRYRESFETPKAIKPNTPLPYKFKLPTANHVFLPGHRVMVQIQSTWFPLYDRNPQTFVPNIFFAKPEDYVKATQRIYRAPGRRASSICPSCHASRDSNAGAPEARLWLANVGLEGPGASSDRVTEENVSPSPWERGLGRGWVAVSCRRGQPSADRRAWRRARGSSWRGARPPQA